MRIALIASLALITLTTHAVAQAPTPLDTMLSVGTHRLHFVVYPGTEPVTVVMEAGGGASLERWAGVEAEIARRSGATVVAYERAGFGESELGPLDLMPTVELEHLDRALEALGVPGRRILVGHSFGGMMSLAHARQYPGKVSALVLVDPMNPHFADATGDFLSTTVPHIENPANDREYAIRRLVLSFGPLAHEARPAMTSHNLPLVVISAGNEFWGKPDIDRAWRASHEFLAQQSAHGRLVIADGADHDIPEERPDTIVEAVLAVMPVAK